MTTRTRNQQISPEARRQSVQENLLAFLIALALFAFLYFFFDVFVVCFGAVLVAALLTLLARPFRHWLKLHDWAALLIAGILLLGAIGAAAYLFGTRLVLDIQDVAARMEAAQHAIRERLQSAPLGGLALSKLGGNGIPVTQILASIFSISTTVAAGVIVSVIAGVYFAAQPALYLNGFLILIPPEKRQNAEETATHVVNALYLWLEGQFISMALIASLSAAAVWSIGLPSPLALGLIAGITEFIPYVGPILAAVPAILVASTQGADPILWTIVAYLGIHTLEGNFIAPLVQRQMVYIPPAVMVLGIAAIGFIFGTVAIIFAAPMTVVLFVLIKKLYVREVLHEPTQIPGERQTAKT
jgi:predicted PurR-regulated permease PerM